MAKWQKSCLKKAADLELNSINSYDPSTWYIAEFALLLHRNLRGLSGFSLILSLAFSLVSEPSLLPINSTNAVVLHWVEDHIP